MSDGLTVGTGADGSYSVAVSSCARCHGDHESVQFVRLTYPTEQSGMTHWAKCPTNGEPILGKQIETED
jgi:hypothetical protein